MDFEYQYRFGGFRIRVISNEALDENEETLLFSDEFDNTMADLACHLHIVDVLPPIAGRLVSESVENRVYFDGSSVWQERIDRMDTTPICLSRFDLDAGAKVDTWALARYRHYTAKSAVLWSAMDLPYQLLNHGVLTLHSASVETGGKAVLFSAPSGTGKSTQASLWAQFRGAIPRNGDKNCICVNDGMPIAYGTPFRGTSDICTNFKLPLGAIVFLRQAPVNEVRRMKGISVIKAILDNSFGHAAIPGCTAKLMAIAEQIANCVPVYQLSCTPDERAVEALEAALQKEG